MRIRLHYLQHVPFEGLGSIEQWAESKGYPITSTCLWQNTDLPAMDAFDMLVIMGGPMSIFDEKDYPRLKQEKRFVEQAIRQQKAVLGICLGAQLIANVLGANVYPNSCKEIGWFPVEFTTEGIQTAPFSGFPSELIAFHWHGETFDLPEGATLVASSKACRNQAFYYPENIIGLQFHLESTAESIKDLVANCSHELIEAPFIQNKEMLLANSREQPRIMSCYLFNMLDQLISGLT